MTYAGVALKKKDATKLRQNLILVIKFCGALGVKNYWLLATGYWLLIQKFSFTPILASRGGTMLSGRLNAVPELHCRFCAGLPLNML